MPFYRPLFGDGELVERKQETEGRVVLAKTSDCDKGPQASRYAWRKPQVSWALGLENPAQFAEFNEALASQGVTGAYYRKDGAAVIESRAARNRLMRFWNAFDADAGYGDRSIS